MTDLEYNLYIENYLENDKTKSAIMLVAPWGMGKSYYIQNCLIPYLEINKNKKCVVVLLYGMNDIKEISKAIYLEIRTHNTKEKNEKNEANRIIGKTILKGVLSKVGIDLSLEENDLERLYSSIDLSNKLLIFEDLERSNLCVKQVLGYVNNLVEQDGAKVLLVANENEIKEFKQIETKDKSEKSIPKWVYTDETVEYLKIKEKTVSDTILYLCDYEAAIQNILKMFNNPHINMCLEIIDKNGKSIIIKEILNVMMDVGIYNLRSLIFACQKTVDIFAKFTDDLNLDYFKYVFMGNVAFSLRLKNSDDLEWNEKTNPNMLGTSKYPLHKFCYDFIKHQTINISEIKSKQEAFIEKIEYEKKQQETNSNLNILYDFTIQKEDILSSTIESIRDDLKNTEIIPLTQYGKLANYLIAVRCIVNNPNAIDECKSIMIENIQSISHNYSKVLDRLEFHDSFNLWDKVQVEEYSKFIGDMVSILQNTSFIHIESDDPIEYLSNVTQTMKDNDSYNLKRKSFLEIIDISKIILGLEKASSKQISEFRSGILNIYRIANIRDFLPNDKEYLVKLMENVQNLVIEDKGNDKVIKLQYKWLVNNLEMVLENY